MTARELASKLATVPERARSALQELPDLPVQPWRRSRPALALPTGFAVFGLGLALGLGIGLLLSAGSAAADEAEAARRSDGGAEAEPRGNPIQ
jgi:hypothetical protein